MLSLTEHGVEIFIKRFNNKSQESFWDNYNLIIWKQNPGGYTNINGMYRNNSWGMAHKVAINEKGIWTLSKKYVKYFK